LAQLEEEFGNLLADFRVVLSSRGGAYRDADPARYALTGRNARPQRQAPPDPEAVSVAVWGCYPAIMGGRSTRASGRTVWLCPGAIVVRLRDRQAPTYLLGHNLSLPGSRQNKTLTSAHRDNVVQVPLAATARAIGVHSIRVENPGELPAAIQNILSHNGPALLDVVTNTQELSMPPVVNLEEARGFGLWALRSVLNGRGDELIELARTNLLR
jgi:hypothetical protein